MQLFIEEVDKELESRDILDHLPEMDGHLKRIRKRFKDFLV